MGIRLIVAVMLATSYFKASAWAQPASGRIETRTRLVAIFSDLNQQFFQAIQQRDGAALNQFIADDFEARTARHVAEPQPRESWQRDVFARGMKGFRISAMSVRGLGDNAAVASFVLEEKLTTAQAQRSLVVQVWSLEGNSWKCKDAYFFPAGTSRLRAKGDRKPTGKD